MSRAEINSAALRCLQRLIPLAEEGVRHVSDSHRPYYDGIITRAKKLLTAAQAADVEIKDEGI